MWKFRCGRTELRVRMKLVEIRESHGKFEKSTENQIDSSIESEFEHVYTSYALTSVYLYRKGYCEFYKTHNRYVFLSELRMCCNLKCIRKELDSTFQRISHSCDPFEFKRYEITQQQISTIFWAIPYRLKYHQFEKNHRIYYSPIEVIPYIVGYCI